MVLYVCVCISEVRQFPPIDVLALGLLLHAVLPHRPSKPKLQVEVTFKHDDMIKKGNIWKGKERSGQESGQVRSGKGRQGEARRGEARRGEATYELIQPAPRVHMQGCMWLSNYFNAVHRIGVTCCFRDVLFGEAAFHLRHLCECTCPESAVWFLGELQLRSNGNRCRKSANHRGGFGNSFIALHRYRALPQTHC